MIKIVEQNEVQSLPLKAGRQRKRSERNNYRAIYERAWGKVPLGYVIHHVDGNRLNNDPMNLIALMPYIHNKLHRLYGGQMSRWTRDMVQGFASAESANYAKMETEWKDLIAKRDEINKRIITLQTYLEINLAANNGYVAKRIAQRKKALRKTHMARF